MLSDGFLLLVRQAQAGDPQAAESLLAAARPHLEQIAQSYSEPSGGDASRSDFVQMAWLRAWERLDQFHGAGTDAEALAAFRAWLGQIVRTSVLNWERDMARKCRSPGRPILELDVPGGGMADSVAVDLPDGEPTPATQAAADEEGRLVRKAVEGLEDSVARQIIWLRFSDQLSLQKIAETLGLDYDDVRRRFREGLERLEEKLDGVLWQGRDE